MHSDLLAPERFGPLESLEASLWQPGLQPEEVWHEGPHLQAARLGNAEVGRTEEGRRDAAGLLSNFGGPIRSAEDVGPQCGQTVDASGSRAP